MNTLLIQASPKKRFSNSAYFMGFAKLFMQTPSNSCVQTKLPLAPNYKKLLELVKQADRVVLATPLYVDGIPSHVLRFLEFLEKACKDENIQFTLYVLSNCGFYEGHQTKHLLAQMEAWTKRSGSTWGGGIGIGTGEMLGFLRLTLVVFIALFLFSLFQNLFSLVASATFSLKTFLDTLEVQPLLIRIGIFALFNLTAAYTLIRFGLAVRSGKKMKIRYTGVAFCPKFLFVIFADLYWALRLCIVNRRLPHRFYHREELIK